MTINTNKIAACETAIAGEATAIGNAQERRMIVGQAMYQAGFRVDTHYKKSTAKAADVVGEWETVKHLAAFYLPAEVREALHDDTFAGARVVTGAKPRQSKTDWSKRIPACMRDLAKAQETYETARIAEDRRTFTPVVKDDKGPKVITARVKEFAKLIKTIMQADTEARAAQIDVDVSAMIRALGTFQSEVVQAHEHYRQALQEAQGDE